MVAEGEVEDPSRRRLHRYACINRYTYRFIYIDRSKAVGVRFKKESEFEELLAALVFALLGFFFFLTHHAGSNGPQ